MVWTQRDQVAIAGVGYSELTRTTSETLGALTLQAVQEALANAGVSLAEVDGVATSPSMPRYGGEKGSVDGVEVVTPMHLADRLGIRDQLLWSGSTLNMVTSSVIDAVNAIAAGQATTVVVYRALHVPQGSYVNFDSSRAFGDDQFRAPYGFSSPPAWAGTVMQRYIQLHGYDREDFARALSQNREHARLNPRAFWRDRELSVEQYLQAKLVADPVSIFDCDIPVNGAAALVLTSAVTARARGVRPALITAMASTAHAGPRGVPMNLEDMRLGAGVVGERLFRSSGLLPQQIDTAQLYDGFSILAPVWAEGVGLAEIGEGLALIRDEGGIAGRLPVNTGGGALGEGRLHGLTQILEAALQVSDQAGARQVPGASHALATVSNGLAGSAGFIISRDGAQG